LIFGETITILDGAGGVTATNTLTIARAGSDVINGSATSVVLTGAREYVVLMSGGPGGGGWYIVSYGNPPTVSASLATGSSTTITTNTAATKATLSIPPGTWALSGAVELQGSGVTVTSIEGALSTTTNAFDTIGVESGRYVSWNFLSSAFAGATSWKMAIPTTTIQLAAATSYYMVVRGIFSAGSMWGAGLIRATRLFPV
jgi:hypothetical protein